MNKDPKENRINVISNDQENSIIEKNLASKRRRIDTLATNNNMKLNSLASSYVFKTTEPSTFGPPKTNVAIKSDSLFDYPETMCVDDRPEELCLHVQSKSLIIEEDEKAFRFDQVKEEL
jgi:hypothetical protein